MNRVAAPPNVVVFFAMVSLFTGCAKQVLTSINPGPDIVGDWVLRQSEASRYTHDARGLSEAARRRGQEYCAARGKALVIDHDESADVGGGAHVGIGVHSLFVAHSESHAVHRVFFRCAFPDDIERAPQGTPRCEDESSTFAKKEARFQAARFEFWKSTLPRRPWVDEFSGPYLDGVFDKDTTASLTLGRIPPRVGTYAVGPWKGVRLTVESTTVLERWRFEALSGSFVLERIDSGVHGRLQNVLLFGTLSLKPGIHCTLTIPTMDVDALDVPAADLSQRPLR